MELALSMAAGELQLLAEAGHVEPRVTYGTTSLCDAFGGPDIDPKQATRIVLKAVLIEGDECQRRALPWHFAKRFTEAFATLTTCRGRTRPAAPDERTATGQFTAGWHAAEPFFQEAHRACGLEDTVPGAPAKRRRRGPKGVPADPSSAASNGTEVRETTSVGQRRRISAARQAVASESTRLSVAQAASASAQSVHVSHSHVAS